MFEVFSELSKFNGILFDESDHSYFYNGLRCTSTTTLLSKFKKPFETDIIASRYATKNGLIAADVIQEWENIRDASASKGTEVHKYAELLFSNKHYDVDKSTGAQNLTWMVDNFYKDYINKLLLIKSELIVGDLDLRVCGMLDKLFYNVEDSELQIWDYKTNKEINTFSKYKNKMTNGLEHLAECEYNTYSLQLGVYKKIREKNTNLRIGKSYICWINDSNDNYKVIKTKDLDEEVELVLNLSTQNDYIF
jgi:hypothetical protein